MVSQEFFVYSKSEVFDIWIALKKENIFREYHMPIAFVFL